MLHLYILDCFFIARVVSSSAVNDSNGQGNWPGFCLGDGFNTSHYIDSITFGDLVMLESCHVTSQWHHVSHVATLYIPLYVVSIYFNVSLPKTEESMWKGFNLRWLGHGKLPSPQYLEISDRNRSTFWILLNPFGILSSPFGSFCTVCGLLWLSGYWIHLDTVDVNSTNNRPDEMIWNDMKCVLNDSGKDCEKIVTKEILYSGGSWVLDVRFLVCLVRCPPSDSHAGLVDLG